MIKELRTKYSEKFGKRPYHGWDEEQLLKKMEAEPKKVEKTIETKVNPILEKARLENEALLREHFAPEPVYLEGKAFYIIDNKYVPYYEGRVHILKLEIASMEAEIENITKLYLSN